MWDKNLSLNRIELETIMFSEISQSAKDKYHMTSFITGIYEQNNEKEPQI